MNKRKIKNFSGINAAKASKNSKKNFGSSKNKVKNKTQKKYYDNKVVFKFIVIMLVITLIDQMSKVFFESFLLNEVHNTYEILPFFNLSLAYNYGISFSMFGDVGSDAKFWFIGISSVIILILLYVLYSDGDTVIQEKKVVPIALIISGAINNVVDRLRVGAVVDFLDFHLGDLHYPIFNIADSAVVIGVVILVWQNLNLKNKT